MGNMRVCVSDVSGPRNAIGVAAKAFENKTRYLIGINFCRCSEGDNPNTPCKIKRQYLAISCRQMKATHKEYKVNNNNNNIVCSV